MSAVTALIVGSRSNNRLPQSLVAKNRAKYRVYNDLDKPNTVISQPGRSKTQTVIQSEKGCHDEKSKSKSRARSRHGGGDGRNQKHGRHSEQRAWASTPFSERQRQRAPTRKQSSPHLVKKAKSLNGTHATLTSFGRQFASSDLDFTALFHGGCSASS